MTCKCQLYSSKPKNFEEVRERGAAVAQILPALTLLTFESSKWIAVYRCKVCDALWAAEYPFGEMQGGGPQCFYTIEARTPEEWLRTAESLTAPIRQEYEDKEFFMALGPELGPEKCRVPDCRQKRIQYSVMCRRHHFEMVKDRPYLYDNCAQSL